MTVDETVDWLLSMDLNEFRDCVQTDLMKKASAELAAALRHPAVVDRWYMALLQAEASVRGQLATRDEDLAGKQAKLQGKMIAAEHRGDVDRVAELRREEQELLADRAATRGKTLRFKIGLEQWLAEARFLRAQRDPDRQFDRLAGRVLILEDAIVAHRDGTLAEEIDPSEMDRVLWKVID